MACYPVTRNIPDEGYALTTTDSNSGLHREFWSDLSASSAVNLPMSNASLRLVVISIGVNEITCGNSYSTLWHVTAWADSNKKLAGDLNYDLKRAAEGTTS
jgi:hypothetical protein